MQLYVGNLSYGTNEQALTDLFSTHGEVISAKIIVDRDSGRSKGFGFVEMTEKSDAIKAISQLDGQEVDGRNIRVNEAQKKSDNRGGGGGGGGGGRW